MPPRPKPKACVGCALYEKGEGFVPGHGPKGAKLALVGEAPGAEEAAEGLPFVGGAGRMLDALLKQAGIKRETCFVDNVLRCRPPGNVYPTGAVRKQAEAHCRVHDQIGHTVHPNVVVALGDKALTRFTGQRGITKWRGSIIDMPGKDSP